MLPSSLPLSPGADPVNLRRKIYELILDQKERFGCLPTQDDIRRVFGNVCDDVDLHLQQLSREGLLLLDRNGGNGISLVPTYVPLPEIELLGKVAHGLSQQLGCRGRASIGLDLRGIGVPLQPGMQAVQVLDDRMSDADILFGDIALLVNTIPVTTGCIVAIEEADVVVLRRYIILSGIPHFLAENPITPELIPAWNAEVQGVLWGLIRTKTCRCAVELPAPKQRVSYANDLPSAVGESARAVPTEQSQTRSRKPRQPRSSNVRSSARVVRSCNKEPDWPKPPVGHELNEAEEPFRLCTQQPKASTTNRQKG